MGEVMQKKKNQKNPQNTSYYTLLLPKTQV